MMADWNSYRQQLVETIGKIAQLSPDTVRGYSVLGAAGSKTKHLDPKIRELIALAVAVTLRCDGCITVHTDAAIKQGAHGKPTPIAAQSQTFTVRSHAAHSAFTAASRFRGLFAR